jgi:hypothetical protein
MRLFYFATIIVILLSWNSVFADQISWDGGGSDSLWTNALNWSADAVPTYNDTVTVLFYPTKIIFLSQNETKYCLIKNSMPSTKINQST